MTSFTDEYAKEDDQDKQYLLLRKEAKRLREEASDYNFRDNDEIKQILSSANGRFDGALVAFLANDFGLPLGYRPDGTDLDLQRTVRETILEDKYKSDEELNEIRSKLLETDARIHKALVAVVEDSGVRYHAPGGKNDNTRFLTVRELVGLVDYVTNSSQQGSLSKTY